mmetsp:Transcript_5461/g.9889  ORF Transcript_5461/g.9889 Transcript_5461/m.9889 type:complete len:497 (-) Transcript_5461:82-1572(-)
MLTGMGRRVFGSLLMLPVLWYIGYFDWWLLARMQQLIVTVTTLVVIAVFASPKWPDPDMDPVSAIIINKDKLLPAGSITHLTLVFYFDDCPSLADVIESARALLEYDRFCSVPVAEPSAIFESSWRKVEFEFEEHFGERKVNGDEEFEAVLTTFALKHFKQPENSPLWRFDVLRNTNGRSAVVWRLDHSIGDGIGILPVGYKFATTMDGKPAKPMTFRRKKIKGKKGVSLTGWLNTVLKDIKTVTSLANGPFDNLETINRNFKKKALEHNGKRVRVDFEFDLSDIKNIRKATGFTINDIVVALFAGACRNYCEKMKDPILGKSETIKMTGLAPFAEPRGMRPGKIQNKMVFVHFAFPIAYKTIKERLQAAHEEFDHLKRSIQVPLLSFITETGTKLGLEAALTAENTKIWHRTSWVFSNVPGPQERMVVFGKEMVSFKPFYCNVLHQAIFFSYAGRMSLGLVLDTESIAKPKLLVECFKQELEDAKKMASLESKEQ